MGARDFWYQSERRHEHSSVSQTVGCLPGTWEALGCLIWEPWSVQRAGLAFYGLCSCSFVKNFTCAPWFSVTTLSRGNIFSLHYVGSLVVQGNGFLVTHSLCTVWPHFLLFYRRFFSSRGQLYSGRKGKLGQTRPLKIVPICCNTWLMQHVLLCHLTLPHGPSPSLGCYIRHRYKHH